MVVTPHPLLSLPNGRPQGHGGQEVSTDPGATPGNTGHCDRASQRTRGSYQGSLGWRAQRRLVRRQGQGGCSKVCGRASSPPAANGTSDHRTRGHVAGPGRWLPHAPRVTCRLSNVLQEHSAPAKVSAACLFGDRSSPRWESPVSPGLSHSACKTSTLLEMDASGSFLSGSFWGNCGSLVAMWPATLELPPCSHYSSDANVRMSFHSSHTRPHTLRHFLLFLQLCGTIPSRR